jgi:ribosomal protein L11 methyltransferase
VIRLAVRVCRAQAEIVLAELLELAPGGLEEVDVATDVVEYAVYGSPGELPALPDLQAAVGGALVEISTSEIAEDWQDRWKRFHRPVLISGGPLQGGHDAGVPDLYVRPPWEVPADGRALDIVIDPGQAFGTGAHPTTRLCLELLIEVAAGQRPRGALLDVGTGSGLLAIAGAMLGFDPVVALDHERESVEAASANAARNGVEVDVRRFDLRSEPLPKVARHGPPPGPLLVVANLLRPLLLALERGMLGAPDHMIAGGLLAEQVDEVVEAYSKRLSMREHQRRHSGEWSAVWMVGPGRS